MLAKSLCFKKNNSIGGATTAYTWPDLPTFPKVPISWLAKWPVKIQQPIFDSVNGWSSLDS